MKPKTGLDATILTADIMYGCCDKFNYLTAR